MILAVAVLRRDKVVKQKTVAAVFSYIQLYAAEFT